MASGEMPNPLISNPDTKMMVYISDTIECIPSKDVSHGRVTSFYSHLVKSLLTIITKKPYLEGTKRY